VRAWSQEVPASPSPLERGDTFYAAGQFPEARLEYKAQTQASTDPAIRQEAQFKEALCHLELKELPRATAIFESLAKDESTLERWRIMSSCQLWGLLLQQGKEKEADLIFRSLNPRYRIGELALFLPDHLRDNILNYYHIYYPTGIGQLMERPNQVPGLERALEIEEFFDTPRAQRQLTRFHLFRAYAKNGMAQKAMATAVGIVKEAPFPTAQNQVWWFPFWEEYPLLLRQQKQADRALVELDRRLSPKKKEYRADCLPLLVDRACVHVALERWDAAERDLEEFFRRVKQGDVPARFWSRACLARGLLRERRGDAPGALDAWRLGLVKDGPHVTWTLDRSSPIALVQEMILAARCQQLSDMDVENLIQQAFQQMGGYMEGMGFKAAAKLLLPELSPEVLGPALRDMWQTPEGRRLAHQVAFRELPLPELYRGVMVNAFVGLGQRMLEPYKLSPEELQLARQLGNDGYTAFASGKLGRRHILDGTQLGALWRNQSSFLGWDYHARGFEPSLRGPMAYFFGLRYLHVHKNTKEADVYFQRALKAAPSKSSLHTLASAELKRLKEKK
jgi:tetratricopeptide (TPR) repeat protein